jgi:hypothetical protein
MSESKSEPSDPGLRIEQIDAEMQQVDREMQRVKDGKDESSARSRAELQERLQQLKSEKNMLIKRQDASQD